MGVIYATGLPGTAADVLTLREREGAKLAVLAAASEGSVIVDGFVAVLVMAIAQALSVSRETVRRAVNDLAAAGIVLTRVDAYHTHARSVEKVRWVRLVFPIEEAVARAMSAGIAGARNIPPLPFELPEPEALS